MPPIAQTVSLLNLVYQSSIKLIEQMLGSTGHRLPLLLQSNPSESGVSCLSMIARYYGKKDPLKFARHQALCRTTDASMSLVELIGLANNIRLSCQPMRLELAKLFRVARPIILVLKNQHYVVLKSGVHNKLTLHDPLRGYLIMSREQVEHLYSGVALLVLPGAQRVGEPKNDFLAEVQAPLNHFPLRR